ncbi:MAG: RNA polymerase subunit sigma-24, partial [Actinomycetota bacterium]|nr:RNA polymerase subunit sigma-24 [Actinomycetota bacterium]
MTGSRVAGGGGSGVGRPEHVRIGRVGAVAVTFLIAASLVACGSAAGRSAAGTAGSDTTTSGPSAAARAAIAEGADPAAT